MYGIAVRATETVSTSLQRRLRDTGICRVNRVHLGRPGQRIVENEQRVIDIVLCLLPKP